MNSRAHPRFTSHPVLLVHLFRRVELGVILLGGAEPSPRHTYSGFCGSRVSLRLGQVAFALMCAGCVLSLSGCLYASGSSTRLGLVAPERLPFDVEILAQGIEAEDCSGSYGDYGAAVSKAVASVPGATMLVDARFESKERVGLAPGICVRVVGNAARAVP